MPNGWQAKKPPRSCKVAALITSVLGAASPCRRAARLGVSPRASCSCRRAAPHVAHHHQPGMDPQAHGQLHPLLLRQAGIELAQGLDHPQPGPHRPLGVIFVRQGIAEVDQQAIAEILGDMPLKAGDHLGAGVLIGPHHLAQVFRVELAGERGRVHQVTEQHGELAAFGVSAERGAVGGGTACTCGRRGLPALEMAGGGLARR